MKLLGGKVASSGSDRRHCSRRSFFRFARSAREQLLDSADGIAVLVEKAVDAVRQRNVSRTVVATITGALEWAKLRETRFPIAEDVLRNAQILGELADGPEGLVALARSFSHGA